MAGKQGTKKKVTALVANAKAEKALSDVRKKERALELLDLIARRKTRILEDFYDIGLALAELSDKQLYLALGFASFEKLLAARDVIAYSQAKRLMAVVAQMPRAQAVKLGQERAYALVAYASATPAEDDPAQLAKQDARIGGKPVSQASLRHIEGATKTVRAKARAAKPASAADRAAASLVRAARTKILAAFAKIGAPRATIEARGAGIAITLTPAQVAAIAKGR